MTVIPSAGGNKGDRIKTMKHQFKIRDVRKRDQYKLDDAYLNGYAKYCGAFATLVYNSLARHADFNTQECWPSIDLIAEQHGISKPSVIKGLKALEKWGIIKTVREKDEKTKRQKNNTYLLIDKSDWIPRDTRVNDIDTESRVNNRTEPGQRGIKSRVNEVDCKDNTLKDNTLKESAALPQWPFELKEELEKMKNDKQRHIQMIGEYLEEKKVPIETKQQLAHAIKRHVRAARQLADFSDARIEWASAKASRDYPEWTLETLIKILTR